IIDPTSEPDPQVRLRLLRLRAWGSTTVYPTVLYLLELRTQGKATSAEIARAMLYLESYLVRRLIIGRATAGLNRILPALVTEIDKTLPVDEAIHLYLSSGRKHYATDEEIMAAVDHVEFYLNGKGNQRKLILEWLEASSDNKEPVMPGRLT